MCAWAYIMGKHVNGYVFMYTCNHQQYAHIESYTSKALQKGKFAYKSSDEASNLLNSFLPLPSSFLAPFPLFSTLLNSSQLFSIFPSLLNCSHFCSSLPTLAQLFSPVTSSRLFSTLLTSSHVFSTLLNSSEPF